MQEDYIFKIYSKKDFTDIEFLKFRNLNIDVKSFSDLLSKQQFKSDYSNVLVSKLISFYDGAFIPDKVDVYEPISEKFTESIIPNMIDWLSKAGGGLMCKKNKNIKYLANFENNRISKIWSDGISNLEFNDPIYLSQLTLVFPKLNIKNLVLVEAFCNEITNASTPCISYLYKGKNFNLTDLENFNLKSLNNELNLYDSELVSCFSPATTSL